MPKTIFAGPVSSTAVDDPLHTGLHLQSVIGMHVARPEFDPRGRRIITKVVPQTVAPPNIVGYQIPIPQDIVGGSGDETQLFFMSVERLLRLLTSGDVADCGNRQDAFCSC